MIILVRTNRILYESLRTNQSLSSGLQRRLKAILISKIAPVKPHIVLYRRFYQFSNIFQYTRSSLKRTQKLINSRNTPVFKVRLPSPGIQQLISTRRLISRLLRQPQWSSTLDLNISGLRSTRPHPARQHLLSKRRRNSKSFRRMIIRRKTLEDDLNRLKLPDNLISLRRSLTLKPRSQLVAVLYVLPHVKTSLLYIFKNLLKIGQGSQITRNLVRTICLTQL